MIAIESDRDTHQHYPHPPSPGSLRAIGAAAWWAARTVAPMPDLKVRTTPLGVLRVEVAVEYTDPGLLRFSKRKQTREAVQAAVQRATQAIGLPGVTVVVKVTAHWRGGAN